MGGTINRAELETISETKNTAIDLIVQRAFDGAMRRAARIDRTADLLLSIGRVDAAERLSQRGGNPRGVPMNRAQWQADMNLIRAESGGLFRVHCVGPEELLGLLSHSLVGDPQAIALVQVITETTRRILTAPKRLPALCGCCPRPLSVSDATFCVAIPERSDPSGALGFGLCSRCGANPGTRQEKALLAITSLWPAGRPVAITHPTGSRA